MTPTPTTIHQQSPAIHWVRTGLRRSAYSALALPVGLAALVVTPFGGAGRAGRWQRGLAARFLDETGLGRAHAVRHAVVSLPVSVLAFVLVVPIWAIFVTRGIFYPAFGADNLEDSWGGPTLAGAWFVHFIQGPPLIMLSMALIAPVNRLQARLVRRYL